MDAAVLLAVCLKGGALGAAFGCLEGVRRGIRRDRRGRAKEPDASRSGLPLGLLRPGPAVMAGCPWPAPDLLPGSSAEEAGVSMRLCDKEFVSLLRRLVSEARHLQNDPAAGVTPAESRAATLIRDELDCFAGQDGPLVVEEIPYVPGRANLKVTYRGQGTGTVSFVGAHLDTAWQPSGAAAQGSRFRLRRSGDELRGAGVGAGLGHAALLVQLLCALAREQPKLSRSVVVVFFAARVAGENGVGADALLSERPSLDGRRGPRLDELRGGPVFWLDDLRGHGLCRGSMGSLSWTLESCADRCITGPGCRSVDSISLASEALTFVQRELQRTFSEIAEQERQHGYVTGSVMSPAQISCVGGARGQTTIYGQIRLTPFLEPQAVMEKVDRLVDQFAEERRRSDGTAAGLSPDHCEIPVDLRWGDRIEIGTVRTVRTCKDRREGNRSIVTPLLPHILEGVTIPPINLPDATASVEPSAQRLLERVLREDCSERDSELETFCADGCIPHLRHAQREGFDIQLCGFGPTDGDADCCSMKLMHRGFDILRRVIFLQERLDMDCAAGRGLSEPQVPSEQESAEQRLAEQATAQDPRWSPIEAWPIAMARKRSYSEEASPSQLHAALGAERRRASSPLGAQRSPCGRAPARRSASWADGGRAAWAELDLGSDAACRLLRTPDGKEPAEDGASVTATPDLALNSDGASVLATGHPSSRRQSPGRPDSLEDPLPAQESPGASLPCGAPVAEERTPDGAATREASRIAQREGSPSPKVGWLLGLFRHTPAPCIARDQSSPTPTPRQWSPRRPPRPEVRGSPRHDAGRGAPGGPPSGPWPCAARTARRLEW